MYLSLPFDTAGPPPNGPPNCEPTDQRAANERAGAESPCGPPARTEPRLVGGGGRGGLQLASSSCRRSQESQRSCAAACCALRAARPRRRRRRRRWPAALSVRRQRAKGPGGVLGCCQTTPRGWRGADCSGRHCSGVPVLGLVQCQTSPFQSQRPHPCSFTCQADAVIKCFFFFLRAHLHGSDGSADWRAGARGSSSRAEREKEGQWVLSALLRIYSLPTLPAAAATAGRPTAVLSAQRLLFRPAKARDPRPLARCRAQEKPSFLAVCDPARRDSLAEGRRRPFIFRSKHDGQA